MSPRQRRVSAAIVIAIAAVISAAIGVAPVRADHVLVSQVSSGGNGPLDVEPGARLSEDASKILFSTRESLAPADSDASIDVYERSAGVTTLVSAPGNGPLDATLRGSSQDGARVFFETREALTGADSDASVDVYERAGGATTIVSGGNGAFDARFRAASADGSHVMFDTQEQLAGADTDAVRDVYERTGGTTVHVSTDLPAATAASPTGNLVLVSTDGAAIFFTAGANVWERSGGATVRVSTGPLCSPCIGAARLTGISEDGSRVYFEDSRNHTLDDNDICGEDENGFFLGCEDVYERSAGVTTLLSEPYEEGSPYLNSFFAGASADGSRAFVFTDDFLTPDDGDQGSFDYFERSGSHTRLVSTGPADDGIDFSDPTLLWVSRDGTRVFFELLEAMTFDDTDTHTADVYGWSDGVTALASVGTGGQNGASPATFEGAADDASRMFFATTDPLSPADTDSALDVYERVGHASTALLLTGPQPTTVEAVSRDGTSVVVRTADQLLPADTDSAEDLYLFRAPAGYARPKGATPLTVSLVPAYAACGAPNRTHGPPLAFGSCGPPTPASSALTVGTPDANGSPARFAGTVQAFVGVGNPATPADEADVAIGADLVDVRNAGDLTDHTGVLELRLPLRVTDRLGGEPATVEDLALAVPVPCAATADPASGAHCAVTTTADAQVPGSVPERARSVWGLEQVRIYDGNGSPFAVQGLFVP